MRQSYPGASAQPPSPSLPCGLARVERQSPSLVSRRSHRSGASSGALSARPDSYSSPIVARCLSIVARSTYFVKTSAGLSAPSTLLTVRSLSLIFVVGSRVANCQGVGSCRFRVGERSPEQRSRPTGLPSLGLCQGREQRSVSQFHWPFFCTNHQVRPRPKTKQWSVG